MLLDVQFVTLASVFANLTSYRSYFIVDTDGNNPPLLVMTSSGGGGFSFVYTGDGASYSFHGNTFSYLYSSGTGTYSGYFDTNSVTTLQINGPIIGLTGLPDTLTNLELTSNVDWDISYLTNLQNLKLNLFDSSISQPFLNQLNITNLANLSQVEIHNSELTELNVDGLSSILNLNLSNNSKLSNIINRESSGLLTNLNISNGSFSNVSQFHFPSLVTLNISGMSFSKFDIADFDNSHQYDFEVLENLTAIGCSMSFFSPTNSWIKESTPRSSTLINLNLSQNNFSSIGINLSEFGLFDVTLSSCQLDETNTILPSGTTILDLSNNNLTDFNSFSFSILELSEVNLSNNNSLLTISELNTGVQTIIANNCSLLNDLNLSGIGSLVNIQFQNSSLTSNENIGKHNFLEQMRLSGVPNLVNIDFSGSPINASASTVQKILENTNLITSVDFKDCAQNPGEGLKGPIVLTMTNLLTYMDLSNNSITEFRVDAGGSGLEYLDISNNSISIFNLGDNYINYPNLVTLNVSYNSIPNWTEGTTHTDDLSYMPSLQNLIVNNNQFEYFNLKTGVSSSTINSLDFSNCTNLQYINIGGSNYNGFKLPISNIVLYNTGPVSSFTLQNVSSLSGLTVSTSTWVQNLLEIDSTNTVTDFKLTVHNISNIDQITSPLELKSLTIDNCRVESIDFGTNNLDYLRFENNSTRTPIDLSTIINNTTAISGTLIFGNNNYSIDDDDYITGLSYLSNVEDTTLTLNKASNLIDSIPLPGYLAADNLGLYLGIGITASGRIAVYDIQNNIYSNYVVGLDTLTDIKYDPYNQYFWFIQYGTDQMTVIQTDGQKIKDIGLPPRTNKLVFNVSENKMYAVGLSMSTFDVTSVTFDPVAFGIGYDINLSQIEYEPYNGQVWVCGNADRIEIYKNSSLIQSVSGSTLGITNPFYMTFNTLNNCMYVSCDEGIAVIDCVTDSPSYLNIIEIISLEGTNLKYDKYQNVVICQSASYLYAIDCETNLVAKRISLSTNNIVGITYDDVMQSIYYSLDDQNGGDFDNKTFQLQTLRASSLFDITKLENLISDGWTVQLNDYPTSDESDAQNFLSRNGSTGIREYHAIKSFTKLLKAKSSGPTVTTNRKNIWDKLDVVYPFLPINQDTIVNSTTNSVNNYSHNLVNSGFTISWASASNINFTRSYIELISDSYGDTNFNSYLNLVGSSHSFGFLGTPDTTGIAIGANDGQKISIGFGVTTVDYSLGNSGSDSFVFVSPPSMVTVNRTLDNLDLYLDAQISKTSSLAFSGFPNQNIYLLASNYTGPPVSYYAGRAKGYFIGDNLTEKEVNDLFECWSYYRGLLDI